MIKIIKEGISVSKDVSATYTNEQLVDAVYYELKWYRKEANGAYPDTTEMLDMIFDNQEIEACLPDHPQHAQLLNIISKALRK